MYLHTCFTAVIFTALPWITFGENQELSYVTPTPLIDINKDLKPLYFGSESDYFISTYPADTITAHQVCRNLTDITGKHFRLLTLESLQEASELQPRLGSLNLTGIWTAGEKFYSDNGEISVFWSTVNGQLPMQFKDFYKGASVRQRRDVGDGEGLRYSSDTNTANSLLYPWIKLNENGEGKCRNGKYAPPECEPVECNVTMPDCSTITPPCTIKNQTECSVIRPDCTAKCENCTVTPPQCFAKPKPCTVTTEECQTTRPPCTVETPPCVTTRPPCKTVQPPCDVSIPPPCTTRQPCIPSFRKDNCTTVTFPCRTIKGNRTVCPPPRTICEPEFRCPPPEICQSPAIICPPPLTYCEPETTVCPEAIVTCPKPVIYCPQPVVNCPIPEIVCTQPQVSCSPPVVNCPGLITTCPAPSLQCDDPQVHCPPPVVTCSKPEPCEPPEIPFPPCGEETTTSTTTQRPCPGCGCVFMSKRHDFKWDIGTCNKEYHFICEG
ncbi:unnamed protein product [Orchesella dallaii]|uniref:Uncharacterized protein n=1 Tax=Orchesella dallaii TaxID=48710 RepID=A0ABP1QNA0_9HEXA